MVVTMSVSTPLTLADIGHILRMCEDFANIGFS